LHLKQNFTVHGSAERQNFIDLLKRRAEFHCSLVAEEAEYSSS